MARYLVIVESPTKVKTIKKFLGSNYVVMASNGHVRDLPKSQMGVDLEHDFEPKYITIRGKGEILAAVSYTHLRAHETKGNCLPNFARQPKKLIRFILQLTRTAKEKQFPGT